MATETLQEVESRKISIIPNSATPLALLPVRGQGLLRQMFTDPYVLQKEDRIDLVRTLRECVAQNPEVSDLRVLLGMALCVNFEVEDAISEFEEGVRLAPDNFIAQLKLGELWMRLRVCPKAEHHTREAALLARNPVQSELARKQAAVLRKIMHEGIERSGPSYQGPWHIVALIRKLWNRDQAQDEALATAEIR